MTGCERPDPLLHRTFGAVIAADNAQRPAERRKDVVVLEPAPRLQAAGICNRRDDWLC